MPVWSNKAEQVWTTANTSKTVTLSGAAPSESDLIVVILQLAQNAGPTSVPAGLTLRDSTQNGTNWVGIYTRQGDGTANSFTFTNGIAVIGSAVVMSFARYSQVTLERTGVKLNISNSGTKNIVDLVSGTTSPNTIVLAVASLTSAPTSWGTWNNGYETATAGGVNRLSVGAKAFAASGVTDIDTTITNSPNRAGTTVAWVLVADGALPNVLPTVSVPADYVVYEDQQISVHATAADSDGTIASYAWSVLRCDVTAPTLSNTNTADVLFTPTKPMTLSLRCTVTDNSGGVKFDDITIVVQPDQELRSMYKGPTKPRLKNRGQASILQRYRGKKLAPELGLISEWDFSQASGPFYNTQGALPLLQGDVVEVQSVTSPWGKAAHFSGSNEFLFLSKLDQGALNIGRLRQEITVGAWVYRTTTGPTFIAGSWFEDSGDQRRCYGLQVNEEIYGGTERSIFRVSKYGDWTVGYDENIDYSAHPTPVTNGVWQFHVGTYDGLEIKSYLNGNFTSYLNYTDILDFTYDRNPYFFTTGLNSIFCEFTVGANFTPFGYGNFMIGDIAKLRVWDRALSAGEIAHIYAEDSWPFL